MIIILMKPFFLQMRYHGMDVYAGADPGFLKRGGGGGGGHQILRSTSKKERGSNFGPIVIKPISWPKEGGGGPDPLPPGSAHVYVTGEGRMGWGGVEGSYFMPVEWDPRPAIAQTLAPEQGPQQPSPIQGHRRPYNGTFHLCDSL